MDKALGYFSICAKAGRLVTGADNCIEALKQNKAKMIVQACDASPNAVKRAAGMLFGRRIPLVHVQYSKEELARACGRGAAVAIAAICDEGLAGAFANSAQIVEQQEV